MKEWKPQQFIHPNTKVIAKSIGNNKKAIKLKRPDGVIVYAVYNSDGYYCNEMLTLSEVAVRSGSNN